ncbi:methyltransferase domain-containing protein [Amycolatopsis thermalba]|uniref:Methyltransferase domain-containing protein n=1 Tax=Amycolatopsis thermalba TaxID=944492 RepID=A0ABY4NTG2_9PSEU|nr:MULTISPECIES: class I SAM-dependent methyltransferase [Amycolatopsis]UQS23345.1 methyltransferase domain-containing protein [Amycolatopsis thermalba]
MIQEFAGEVASNYAKFRRGYRPEVLDLLAAEFPLGRVLDLGCGTGQLTVPMAARAGAVIGMDPSPDMLAHARAAEVPNIVWVVGADSDVPALEPLLGGGSLDLVTIGQALHWMDPGPLFAALTRLLRSGGGVAVIANGTPVWTQRSPWAAAIRQVSTRWLGALEFPACGSSEDERARYRDLLERAGFTRVREHRLDHTERLGLDEVVGAFYSAGALEKLDAAGRRAFDTDLRAALLAAEPEGVFTEEVPVRVLCGTWEPSA